MALPPMDRLRFEISRLEFIGENAVVALRSCGLGFASKVNLDDALVVLNLLDWAFTEHLALVKDRDLAAL
jgi:hypothetical protein